MTGAAGRPRRIFASIGWCLLACIAGFVAAVILVMPSPAGPLPDSAPVPKPRPQTSSAQEPDASLPGDEAPLPRDRPGERKPASSAAKEAGDAAKPAAMPPEELACRARLRELGVTFEERERLSGDGGCLVEHPIAITSLGTSVSIEPEAVLNCAMARAAAEFVADIAAPQIKDRFGSALTGVRHGSAYVCRTRHGQGKMSEHAFGNALDFSAFELADGTTVDVKAYGPGETVRRDFLRELRAKACGPFKTVLGPGTDADHATHLHLDLQQRRRGGTWCK